MHCKLLLENVVKNTRAPFPQTTRGHETSFPLLYN